MQWVLLQGIAFISKIHDTMKITYVKKYEKNMFENVMASDD